MISKYYRDNAREMFNSVENPEWRVWKVINKDGTVWQNQSPINTPEKLKQLLRNNPQAVYSSVGCFLNPHKVSGQKKEAGYVVADDIFLWSDLFFDFDSEKNLQLAQEDSIKVLDLMQSEPNYKLNKIQFSGTKGFHLLYKQIERLVEPNPAKRRKAYRKERKRIADKLKKLNLKTYDVHHYNVIQDQYRVYAVTYSKKANSGNSVTPLTKKELRNDNIYKTLETKGIHVPREPSGNDQEVAADSASAQSYRGVKRSRISSPHTFLKFRFVDNAVYGIKDNYVVVIKQRKKNYSRKLIKELQETYNLSDFYIFKVGDFLYSVCFKCVQAERLEKILRKTNSTNLRLFVTRKHLPIHLSSTEDDKEKEVEEWGVVDVVNSENGIYDDHSYGHCKLFGVKYPNMVGTECKPGVMRVR